MYLEWMTVWLDGSGGCHLCKSAGLEYTTLIAIKSSVSICEWRKWDFQGIRLG